MPQRYSWHNGSECRWPYLLILSCWYMRHVKMICVPRDLGTLLCSTKWFLVANWVSIEKHALYTGMHCTAYAGYALVMLCHIQSQQVSALTEKFGVLHLSPVDLGGVQISVKPTSVLWGGIRILVSHTNEWRLRRAHCYLPTPFMWMEQQQGHVFR